MLGLTAQAPSIDGTKIMTVLESMHFRQHGILVGLWLALDFDVASVRRTDSAIAATGAIVAPHSGDRRPLPTTRRSSHPGKVA